MPPQLALFICVAVVGYLLVIDRKQSPNVSAHLWLPTLWVFYCASRPLANWFGGVAAGMGESVEEGSAIDRIVLSVLTACALIVLNRRNFSLQQAFREQRWLMLVYCFMLLSCIWSDYPYVAFKRWVRVFGSLLMAWVVLTEESPFESIESILRRAAYVLLPFSMLLIKYYPDMGVQYNAWEGTTMWVGVTTQKNSIGSLSLIAAFYLIWALKRRWRRGELWSSPVNTVVDGWVLFVALWILKGPGGSYSATAVVALFMGVFMYAFLLRLEMRGQLEKFSLVWRIAIPGICIGIAIPLAGGGGILSGILGFLGRDTTFTGRTDIWGEILPAAWKHPILGVGYGSFWIDPPLRFPLNRLTHSHNGYLDIFVQMGGVGLLLVVGCLLSMFKKAQEALAREVEWAAFGGGLLLILLFHNVTECSLARASSYLWMVALLFAGLLPRLCEDSAPAFDLTGVRDHTQSANSETSTSPQPVG